MKGHDPNELPKQQIIIADDDPSVRFLLKHILEKDNYTTWDAANGDDALKLLDEHDIDMLVIDAVMPGLNGFETCRIVKQKQPDLPVIIITSLDDDASVEEAYNAGADDYITKPINWSVLKHRIARVNSNIIRSAVKITSELALRIEARQYSLHNRFRTDINDESVKAIITYHTEQAHKARRLVDSNISLQLKHARQLIEDSCSEYKASGSRGRFSIFIHPFSANPVQYVNMLKEILRAENLDEEMVECIFLESQLNNKNMIHLYNAISELKVKLHINKFSFSLHALNVALNSRCDAIEIDIPLTYKTLRSDKLIKSMLSEYKDLGVNIYGADISSSDELEFSKLIGCSEVHGPGLDKTSI